MSNSQKKNKFEANRDKWDPLHSSFKWNIYLANGKIFTGYSKHSVSNERMDKDILLQKCIVRLYNAGYLHKKSIGTEKETDAIYFYNNQKLNDPHFLVMYMEAYELDDLKNEKLVNFINRFYEMMDGTRGFLNLIDEDKSKQGDVLALDKPRFSDISSLNRYCAMLVKNKTREQSEIDHFYKRYKEMYLSDSKVPAKKSQSESQKKHEEMGKEHLAKLKRLANKHQNS
jgi:hypothetical protein